MWRRACAVGGARRLCWDRVNTSNITPSARKVAATVTEESIDATQPEPTRTRTSPLA